MTAYSQMSDDELNRLIAERRGWTNFALDDRIGDLIAWMGMPPDWQARNRVTVPGYSSDLNAAAELLKDIPNGGLYFDEDEQKWGTNGWFDGTGLVADAMHDQPARAVSESWLLWTDIMPTPSMQAAKG